MSYAHRIPHLSPARAHRLVAWSIVAVLSFSLGLAAAPLSRRLGAETTTSQLVGVAPEAAPAITGARYDDGWAGGPGQSYQRPAAGDQRITPWTACSACYDQGWAGGPGQGYQPPLASGALARLSAQCGQHGTRPRSRSTIARSIACSSGASHTYKRRSGVLAEARTAGGCVLQPPAD